MAFGGRQWRLVGFGARDRGQDGGTRDEGNEDSVTRINSQELDFSTIDFAVDMIVLCR